MNIIEEDNLSIELTKTEEFVNILGWLKIKVVNINFVNEIDFYLTYDDVNILSDIITKNIDKIEHDKFYYHAGDALTFWFEANSNTDKLKENKFTIKNKDIIIKLVKLLMDNSTKV